jgi:hypothetical protein
VFQSAGLAAQQLEVVIELGAGSQLAVQPLVARELSAGVADRDLAGADAGADPQLGQRDGTE